jgi:hypothetical protein
VSGQPIEFVRDYMISVRERGRGFVAAKPRRTVGKVTLPLLTSVGT